MDGLLGWIKCIRPHLRVKRDMFVVDPNASCSKEMEVKGVDLPKVKHGPTFNFLGKPG